MASKREDQMAAKYAEVVERNKLLERQNAELRDELQGLRANPVTNLNDNECITKAELKHMLSEILFTEREAIQTINGFVRDTRLNQFCEHVNLFNVYSSKFAKRISAATKELLKAASFESTAKIRNELNAISNDIGDSVSEKLIEATDIAISKVKMSRSCIVLSSTAATLLIILLMSMVCYFGVTLAYNYYHWHFAVLYQMQFWCSLVVFTPLFLTLVYRMWKSHSRHK